MTNFTPFSATTSPVSNETERLVIELADAMVTAPSNMSDDSMRRLRTERLRIKLFDRGDVQSAANPLNALLSPNIQN